MALVGLLLFLLLGAIAVVATMGRGVGGRWVPAQVAFALAVAVAMAICVLLLPRFLSWAGTALAVLFLVLLSSNGSELLEYRPTLSGVLGGFLVFQLGLSVLEVAFNRPGAESDTQILAEAMKSLISSEILWVTLPVGLVGGAAAAAAVHVARFRENSRRREATDSS